jgi:hypothetical protein
MKLTKRILILCVLVAASASMSFGYVLLGKKWFTSPDFLINSANFPTSVDQGAGLNAVQNALGSWGTGRYAGTTSRSATFDGYNVVVFARLGGLTLAQTYVGYYDTSQVQSCNGVNFYRFEDTDITVNNKVDWETSAAACGGEYDLNGVMTHEMGHAIGLGHSSVSAATMYASVAACDFSKGSLENDDRDGYNKIYNCGGDGGGCKGKNCK